MSPYADQSINAVVVVADITILDACADVLISHFCKQHLCQNKASNFFFQHLCGAVCKIECSCYVTALDLC